GTHADDERTWEVGQLRSTDEVAEQRRNSGGGGDGGKAAGQGKLARVQRVPDAVPEGRAQRARAGTPSSKKGSEAAVHCAPASRLRHAAIARCLSGAQARCGSGRGWRDVAALR